MSSLYFAQSQWVHLLWGVALFIGICIWLDRSRSRAIDRLLSPLMQARLIQAPSNGQRNARIFFLAATGIFLTLAMMRPQWGVEVVESRRSGAEIMICLDVSRSMLAEDVVPNRLERAKTEIRDLLEYLEGDHVGLIVFAGRASVLSPLTPDFGFINLSLDDANPNSVTRGGTRLEEPLRKAIAGFGDSSDVSRSILLITDGEDHDSFPLEAAKAAAERGIRIIAIGFGAEDGASIPISDPKTGARTLLTDADGNVVQSRLDGKLLRDMALATEGAYIPAGTGQLELESIYERHIAPLTRGDLDGQSRVVRKDIFQWAVLLGFLSLLGAVASTAATRNAAATLVTSPLLVGLVLVAATALLPEPSLAQSTLAAPEQATQQSTPQSTPAGQAAASSASDNAAAPAEASKVAIPDDPRSAYNQGLEALQSKQHEAALTLLQAARSKAGTDAELRFQATYNLGWVEIEQANAALEANPKNALDALYRAASWFRAAIELRDQDEAARRNLEIVMQRALELADGLRKQDEQTLLQALEALMDQQRAFLATLAAAVQSQKLNPSPNANAEKRRQFRKFASAALQLLGQSDDLNQKAVEELSSLKEQDKQGQSAEQALRQTQLESVLAHLHTARANIGQTRTRLRRVQSSRAYRRGHQALEALRRARDQLLDPVARIDALLTDGTEVARLTAATARSTSLSQNQSGAAERPDWLNPDYLAERQGQLDERLQELHQGVQAATNSDAKAQDAQQQTLLERMQKSEPFLASAKLQFAAAVEQLKAQALGPAQTAQAKALTDLLAAREIFLDIRRLIELVYAEENLVQESFDGDQSLFPMANSVHARNVERATRLGRELSDAMIAVEQAAAGNQAGSGAGQKALPGTGQAAGQGAGAQPGPAQPYTAKQLEAGYELLRSALNEMHTASPLLATLAESNAPLLSGVRGQAAEQVKAAVEQLEQLRRLFFSVIEHLKDTARRQQTLNDSSQSLHALSTNGAPGAEKLAPLVQRQGELRDISNEISDALRQQAAADPAAQTPPQQAAPGAPSNEDFQQASEHVSAASSAMEKSLETLSASPAQLGASAEPQGQALEQLLAAIELLEQAQEQDSDNSDDSEQEQEQQENQESQGKQEQPQASPGDLSQLLQGVRDREAERREEQAKQRGALGNDPVERDW